MMMKMKTQETKKAKELIKFLKKPLDGKIAKVLTWEQSKILLNYIKNLESQKNNYRRLSHRIPKEYHILDELEKWLKTIMENASLKWGNNCKRELDKKEEVK